MRPHLLCVLLLLPCVRALGVQTSLQSPPKMPVAKKAEADRTGEPLLLRMLESYGKLRSVDLVIYEESREDPSMPYYPVGRTELRYSAPNRFRVEFISYWGDGVRLVGDGRTVLKDNFVSGQPLEIFDSAKAIPVDDPALAPGGPAASPLYLMLQGKEALSKLVAKDGSIKAFDINARTKGIEYLSQKLGKVTLVYDANDPRMLIRRIEFGPRPLEEPRDLDEPDWDSEVGNSRTIQVVMYRSVDRRIARRTFDTRPPKGVATSDQRKKKGGKVTPAGL